MGSPKFSRKKYDTPLHPWKEDRIKSERELIKKYGLKNHKEVWKAKTYLGKYRKQARELLAKLEGKDPQVKKESDQLLLHLTRMGILPTGSSLDDVLALETESVLSRRLQTLVYLKGLSSTANHSRQIINHGHIAIGDMKVTIPSYMVTKDEEKDIGYIGRSPLNELSHPARPKSDVYKTDVGAVKKEVSEPKEEKVEDKKEIKEETVEPGKEEEKVETKEETKEEKPKINKETIEAPKEKPEEVAEKPKEEEKPAEKPEEKLELKEEVPKKPEVKEKQPEETPEPKEEPTEKPEEKAKEKKEEDK